MKSTCTYSDASAFRPIAVTILLETQQDAEAFRTLVSRNVTIPRLVNEKFFGGGDPDQAQQDVYTLLGDLQAQLTEKGFDYPKPAQD